MRLFQTGDLLPDLIRCPGSGEVDLLQDQMGRGAALCSGDFRPAQVRFREIPVKTDQRVFAPSRSSSCFLRLPFLFGSLCRIGRCRIQRQRVRVGSLERGGRKLGRQLFRPTPGVLKVQVPVQQSDQRLICLFPAKLNIFPGSGAHLGRSADAIAEGSTVQRRRKEPRQCI